MRSSGDYIALSHGVYMMCKLLANISFGAVAFDGIAPNPTLQGGCRINVDVYAIRAERTEEVGKYRAKRPSISRYFGGVIAGDGLAGMSAEIIDGRANGLPICQRL